MYYDFKEIINFWEKITGGKIDKSKYTYHVKNDNDIYYYSTENTEQLKHDLLIDIEIITENKEDPKNAKKAYDFLNYITCGEYSLNNDF